jgi:tRNA pseudouridine13 synthase
MNLPYLTADQPGIGGRLKVKPEDFFVEEIPLYLPTGVGQHVYAEIEKIGLSTHAAIKMIGRALNIPPGAIGYAGLKDAHAITRQTISIDKVTPEVVTALSLPDIKILSARYHHNKLKPGHLTGNRFVIRVREVTQDAIPAVEAIVETLSRRGVPNFFGEQRFGNRGNTGRLGELLVRKNVTEFVAEYLGRPQPQEAPHIRAARQLIDESRWEEALAQWPGKLSDERQAIATIIKTGGQLEVAVNFLNKRAKSLFVAAFQAELFNSLLVGRLERLDQLEDGDVAYLHGRRAFFIVEQAAVEQPRADSFEISPSGPLFGLKTLLAQGIPGQKERAILAEYHLSPEEFDIPGLKIYGTRRPYRFKLKDAKIWWDEGLMISFELQPGAYATTVMAEIMKN